MRSKTIWIIIAITSYLYDCYAYKGAQLSVLLIYYTVEFIICALVSSESRPHDPSLRTAGAQESLGCGANRWPTLLGAVPPLPGLGSDGQDVGQGTLAVLHRGRSGEVVLSER